jgi:hypothetical protein
MKPPVPVIITLTPAQRALIREASGKNATELGIEPVETGSYWLCASGDGKKPWLLKEPDPKSYLATRRKQPPRINPCYTSFRLRIGRSRIHHLGVFAEERIPARRNVIEYVGEFVNPVESYRRTNRAKAVYTIKLDEFWSIDGSRSSHIMNMSICRFRRRLRNRLHQLAILLAQPLEFVDPLFERETLQRRNAHGTV